MPLVRSDLRKLADGLEVVREVAPDLLQATDDGLVTARTIVDEQAAIEGILDGGTGLAAESDAFLRANGDDLARFIDNVYRLLDAVYDNRRVGIAGALIANIQVAAVVASAIKDGALQTDAVFRPRRTALLRAAGRPARRGREVPVTGLRLTAVKFGAFALAAVLLLVVLLNTMSHGLVGETRSFGAEFSDVSGLRVGDDVRVAGVRVGRVAVDRGERRGRGRGLRAREGPAAAREHPDGDALPEPARPAVPRARAEREARRRAGRRRDRAAGPHRSRLRPHRAPQRVPAAVRGAPARRRQQAGQLVVQVLQGEGGTVEQLLQQTTQLTTYVADRDAVIGEVLTNLTPVLEHLQGRGTELEATVLELRKLMEGLAKDRSAIGYSIDGVADLVGTTSSLLQDARAPLVRATKRFVVVADVMARTKDRLNRALASFGGTIGALGRLTSYENAMNVFLCSMTFAVGPGEDEYNPAGRSTKHSQVCQ